MPHAPRQPRPPRELSTYLESITRTVFSAGLSWRVVEAKWPGFKAAFHDFDPARVAALTPKDVDRLARDTRIVRNEPKIQATVDNARTLVALDREPGGFRKFLRSQRSFQETTAALRKRFKFLGENGAYYFLWSVGEKVPSWDKWRRSHQRKAAKRQTTRKK